MRCAVAFLLCLAFAANAATPAVSSGDSHSLALQADGTLRAWGDDSSGQLGVGRALLARAPAAVLGLTDVIQVASAFNHVVALRRDGTVWAWGINNYGQLGDGTNTNRATPAPVEGLSGVIEISAGYGFTLALREDGSVWSWGENYRGQLGYDESLRVPARVPGLPFIRHVSAGIQHSLALDADGAVWAWGNNDMGQLGDGTTTERYTGRTEPRRVIQLPAIAALAGGNQVSFAATAAGLVYAWGGSDDGSRNLGSETVGQTSVPIPVAGVTGVSALSAGIDHTLALLNDGTVIAWGNGYSGQLGDGQAQPSATPVHVTGLANVESIVAATYFSVARTRDGSVWTWGDNTYGEMADGTTQPRIVPQRVTALPPITAIGAAGWHAFGAASDGRLLAWGANDYGELGDGVKPLRTTPALVQGATSVVQVAGGGLHTLAVRADKTVLAWGHNGASQLGDGTRTARSTPAPIEGLSDVVEVGAGYYSSAARKSDGTLWTWGYNYGGLLGVGDQDERERPTQVPGLPPITSFSMGGSHTLAVAADGTVRAWGGNGAGELGDGTTIDRFSPIVVQGLSNVKAVSAGANHSLALKTNGEVWSWGDNYAGELGDGTTTSHAMAARVPGLANVVAISAGNAFSVAVLNDGTVYAWGADWNGQLGDGPEYSGTRLVRVARLRDIVSVSAGGSSVLALKRDGTVSAWGNNIDGRLGDGTFVDRDAPVAVLREDGAGSLEGNDWFLDLNPAIAKTIASDLLPVFLVVTATADGGVTARVRFRNQDLGTTSNIFAFALAPAGNVKGANAKTALVAGRAKRKDGTKDADGCVLAQLDSSGQMQQASAATLQAAASGVLSAQGQTVTLLNNLGSPGVAGATFFVGYGTNGATMIDTGRNRSAVTVQGNVTCEPQGPQTGWWWNPAEGGRGYSIEAQGSRLFFAAFHYEVSGRSTWNVASGPTSLEGSLFTGDLLDVRGGQTLGGAYPGFPAVSTRGPITLAFNDSSHGTMTWPGGTVAIERQPFTPTSRDAAALPNQPENGWWWNPDESGRGFFIEWQGDVADMAGYMYDEAGNPVWFISVYSTPDPRAFAGNWWSYANGQSMGGAYRAPVQTSNTVAPVTVQFSAPDTALMTLPNGRTTRLTRQRF
jgi:alpha-tubulin suppressor-like RCC1 family protein